MNIEHLLIPRVLCKGSEDGQPNDTSGDFFTGDILVRKDENKPYKWYSTRLKHSVYFHYDWVEKFPYLFSFLDWWNNRSEEEMPHYLKPKEDGKLVVKVTKWMFHVNDGGYWAFEYRQRGDKRDSRMAITGWVPATEEEYLKANDLKKCPDCDSIWKGDPLCPECYPLG